MSQHQDEVRLGQNLQAARKRAGLTQKQLADLAKLDRATISLIENGHESPRAHTVITLAQVLGVRPADLWREAPAGWGPGRPSGTLREIREQSYEPMEQHELHPGLVELLEDEKTRSLMRINEEEEMMLRSIRTRTEAPLDKQFFIDVLFAYRRNR